jgi:NADH-quinone oxidoreductase subunit N
MTIANVIGLWQTNVVRLLAYSSIAHMGYMLLGLIAGDSTGIASVYFYGGAYLFMNLGDFAIVICLANTLHSHDLSSFAGLGKKAPLLSALFTLFLLSLAGVPPTVGFVAKFYIFWAALSAGWVWLVILAAVNSVISVGYYFKILRAMYFQSPATEAPVSITLSMRLTLAVTSFVTLFVGMFPQIGFAKAERLAWRPVVEQSAAPSDVAVSSGTPVQP